jgi:hypothetical protein
VPRGRHSLVPDTVPSRRLALLAAPLVTALAVGVGVATSGFGTPRSPSASGAQGSVGAAARPATGSTAPTNEQRTVGTSRSDDRVPLVDHRVPKAKGKLWTTAPLDLRLEPREKSKTAGLIKSGKQVAVTGRTQGAYSEVIVNRMTTRWVTADYLSKNKTPEAMGVSDQPCPDGSSIESALQPASIRTYRAVCAAFPELTTYGGQDGHGEHVNGQAIDFMVPNSDVGQKVADYVYAHRVEFDLFDIIWSQHIWTTERSSEGFRPMEDRGSPTANHMDHVHIMVN